MLNRFTQDPVPLLLQAVIVPGSPTFEGRLIEAGFDLECKVWLAS